MADHLGSSYAAGLISVLMLALAYTFADLPGAIITTVVIGSYRLWLGGAGAMTGVSGILIAAAAGLFIGRIPNRFFKGRLLKPLALGIAASLSSVSVIALPHAALAALSWEIILAVSAMNGCGSPNATRHQIGELIDQGRTNRQIFEELLQDRGPAMLRPHLLR